MLIEESYRDVATTADGKGLMRIYLFHPKIAGYPNARFPGVVVFSEIYQVTGPIQRFCRQIAGHGYVVAAPSSYHEFTGPEPLEYDGPGTDKGNIWKVEKVWPDFCNVSFHLAVQSDYNGSGYEILMTGSTLCRSVFKSHINAEIKLTAYDEDARLSVSLLLELPTCSGRIGSAGVCLGGHLVYRCALDPRVHAAVCFFPTDIHSRSLGAGKADDSLKRAGEIKGELLLIFGKRDNHVPPEGRDLIRKTLHEAQVAFSFYEIAGAQHAFVRDELSKGRYDSAVTKVCFEMLLELFDRVLKTDLGQREEANELIENIC